MSPDTTLAYRVVDVFTDTAYAGNPLAVVLDGDDLTTSQMRQITGEFNLSETAFPLAATTPDATYRLRIFTPGIELPFAGHPSIGAAWVMRAQGRISTETIVQECGAGLLPLTFDGDAVTLTGGEPNLAEEYEPSATLAAVGLDASQFVGDPLRWAGVGIDFGYLHVKPDAVARAVPNLGLLRQLPPSAGISVFSYVEGVAHARVFAAGAGVAEDPATGSAALGLGVWLAWRGYVDGDGESSYVVKQGAEMGRPSTLSCVVACERGVAVATRVTGSVVPIAEGRIARPPR
jgi:trans-2,3-dihydro-3-hydroxyanthranilate isomerase